MIVITGYHIKSGRAYNRYDFDPENRVFSIETILVNKKNLPFAASIVAVCRKT